MTELSTWAKLDTWRMMQEIEAAHGSAVFTKDALLDPHLMVRQINSALGTSLGVQDVLDLCGRGALDINTVLVGGGVPDWVPDNAKIFIDLVGVRAWTEADGEVAVDTLLGSDPNTVNAWAATSYDAGNLTVDGYVSSGAVAFIGAALTKLLDAATFTLRCKQIGSDGIFPRVVLVAADGNNAVEFYSADRNLLKADSYGGSLHLENPSIWNNAPNAINVFAATITSTRAELAANGSDALEGTLDSSDRPLGDPFVAAVLQPAAEGAVTSITIYDALPDTTGLSALSEVPA